MVKQKSLLSNAVCGGVTQYKTWCKTWCKAGAAFTFAASTQPQRNIDYAKNNYGAKIANIISYLLNKTSLNRHCS